MEHFGFHFIDFLEILRYEQLLKSFETFKFCWNQTQISGTLHEDLYGNIFLKYSYYRN